MIKRRNRQENEGLENTFYIVGVNLKKDSEMWQLRMKDSHFVVSAVHSKTDVLRCLREICMRYKTQKILRRVLKHCEFKVGPEHIQRCKVEYEEQGKYYNDIVESIVKECMTAIEEKRNGKKKFTRVAKEEVIPVVKEELKIEEHTEDKVTIRPVNRKKSRIGKVQA